MLFALGSLLFLAAFPGTTALPPRAMAHYPWEDTSTLLTVDFKVHCPLGIPYKLHLELKEVDTFDDDELQEKSYENVPPYFWGRLFQGRLKHDGVVLFPYYKLMLGVRHTCTPDGSLASFKQNIENGKDCPVGEATCTYFPTIELGAPQ